MANENVKPPRVSERWRQLFPVVCLVLVAAQTGFYRHAAGWLEESLGFTQVATIGVIGSVYLGMWSMLILAFLVFEHVQHRRSDRVLCEPK